MIRPLASLILTLCLFSSCASVHEPDAITQPASAAVRARMRGPVAVVMMGLQDQVAIQRPTGRAAVWNEATDHAAETFGSLGDIAGKMDRAAIVLLPFFAATALMPPLRLLTAGGTVSEKRSESAARKMYARAPQRNWGEAVQQSILSEWSARGRAFSSVRVYRPAAASPGPYPLSPQGLQTVSSGVLLFIHVVGPSLTAEGDKLNPRIGPSLLLHWKVVETRSGKILAHGVVAERSPLRKTLLEWANHDDDGMVPEMERVIRAAGARLAVELH